MRLTFATDGDAYSVDVDEDMVLGDIQALLEAESGIPVADQTILHGQTHLTDALRTLKSYSLRDDDMLLLQNKRPASTSAPVQQHDQAFDPIAEMARSQILANPELLQQLRESEPEIANAAENDPAKFRELYNARGDRYRKMQDEKRQMENLLMADPFDVEAQRKIEEMIRQEAVLENMEHAMEYAPESFGRVHMLYVNVEVNGKAVKAFVDSGAQATISRLSYLDVSPDLAESCGIMRLLDRRFAGIARGVGTAKILGRIHSAQIRVGEDLFLPVAFTVMEGKGVDLLFGLDMLKRYQACIDLEANTLRIQGRSVRFLDEHELPRNFEDEVEVDEHGNVKVPSSQPSHGAALGAAAAASAEALGQATAPASQIKSQPQQRFPGGGNMLGPAQPSPPPKRAAQQEAPSHSSRWPEASVEALTSMGVARSEAIGLLDATNGNVDMAANMVFG